MKTIQKLLDYNKEWAAEQLQTDSEYFSTLAKSQKPEFLWIGCADSRVPAEDLTGSRPGEMFVHRNVANLVIHTDMNMLSVLHYAVEVLQVKHVIVVGHYQCGGVRASMGNQDLGLINKWLRNIKDVYDKHSAELEAIADEPTRFDRLVELNVLEQVNHLAETTIVQKAWHRGQQLSLHGWVYGMSNGVLKSIVQMGPESEIKSIYKYQFD